MGKSNETIDCFIDCCSVFTIWRTFLQVLNLKTSKARSSPHGQWVSPTRENEKIEKFCRVQYHKYCSDTWLNIWSNTWWHVMELGLNFVNCRVCKFCSEWCCDLISFVSSCLEFFLERLISGHFFIPSLLSIKMFEQPRDRTDKGTHVLQL